MTDQASDMTMGRATTSPDDRTLADRVVQGGDERAFRTLYRRYTPLLYPFTLRVLGGAQADAEDVVQETWIRAVRQLGGFRWESSLRTWLTAIALNLSREMLRKRSRARTEDIDEQVGLQARPSRDHERLDLESALSRLPEGYRTVLVLHDIEGFTHEEISQQLAIAVGTSKSQLFDARRAMRALLQPPAETRHA
jgi:RNA polymerase sigma-70 factor (ECF subfamily)